MSSGCPSISRAETDPLANVTEILWQRWEDSSKKDRQRLELCWGYTDCGDCHRSKGFCGWCAISSTCLPLPDDRLTHAFPLLSPIRYKFICAQGPERFELRTSGLGCQVSTITFLTSIVTIFATLFGVLVLWGVVKAIKWIVIASKARKYGVIVYEDGRQEIWTRKGESWGKWWRRMRGKLREDEIEEVDGGTKERSWWTWLGVRKEVRGRVPEARPLLG